MLRNILQIFHPPKTIELGRWQLKHDINKCNDYILKFHADPGYHKNKILEYTYTLKIKDQNIKKE